jgi:hypothetical protein
MSSSRVNKASITKKTYNLDGNMIERVRLLFNAKTDTEAIQKDLSLYLVDDRGRRFPLVRDLR